MSVAWQGRREAGSAWLVRCIRGVALASPPLARLMLVPITLYFLIVRHAERRASRRYLRRVFGRDARLTEVARHIHTFARSILDRVAFLSDRMPTDRVRVHGVDSVDRLLAEGRGLLLFGSHLGSFEAVRHVGLGARQRLVRILMDAGQNPQVTALLEELNPQAQASVIDARQDPTRVLLTIHETLAQGGLVGVLADRPHAGEATVPATLLGGTIGLPLGPLRIAAVTGAPVMLIFGLLKPDGSYDVYFEPFADRIKLGRARRAEDAAPWARRFASRLESRLHEAPYNWFNFYDYWMDDARAR